jgi:hypothetical protein
MPWPKGKSRKLSMRGRNAAFARWNKKAAAKVKKKSDWLNLDLLDKNLASRRKQKAMTVHDIAKEVPAKEFRKRLVASNEIVDAVLETDKVAKVKRSIMKENRLRGCKFDPAKAPPPIQFIPSNETPPPADPTDEIIAELKRMGCPMLNKLPEDEIGFAGGESCACDNTEHEESKKQEPTPQFAALSTKFIAELAFHLAQLMRG